MRALTLLPLLLLTAVCASWAEPPAHHAERGFQNPYAEHSHGGFFGIIRARFSNDWQSYDPKRDKVPMTEPAPLADPQISSNAAVTWIGHSTVLVQHRGINLLTDPMFAKRASPIGFVGPARITAPALTVEELPTIHAVILSHDHYDHLDTASIRALGDEPTYFVPLGLADWFTRKGIAPERVIEMDWWDAHTLETDHGSLTLTATPSAALFRSRSHRSQRQPVGILARRVGRLQRLVRWRHRATTKPSSTPSANASGASISASFPSARTHRDGS